VIIGQTFMNNLQFLIVLMKQ